MELAKTYCYRIGISSCRKHQQSYRLKWDEQKHIDLKIQFISQKQAKRWLNNGTSSCNTIAWKKTFHVPDIWNLAGLMSCLPAQTDDRCRYCCGGKTTDATVVPTQSKKRWWSHVIPIGMKQKGETTANADNSNWTAQYQDGSSFLITVLCLTNNNNLSN
jgi:hypothetical protein